MAGAQGDIPVYVIHWNSPQHLSACVDALSRSKGVAAKITVIDNASSDQSISAFLASPQGESVRLARQPTNLGFAHAANVALADASQHRHDWFIVAAHDSLVDEGTLAAFASATAVAKDAGVLGAVLCGPDRRTPVSQGAWWDEARGPKSSVLDDAFFGKENLRPVDWVSGALMCLRTSAVEEVGGFDASLFMYCEDVDLCLRLRDRGFAALVVRGARTHEPGHALPTDRHIYLIARNSLALIRSRSGSAVASKAVVRVGLDGLRASIGSILPWRSHDRRRESALFARGELRASWETARTIVRGSTAGSRRFPTDAAGKRQRRSADELSDVSVVIPTWHRSEWLARSLEAVVSQNPPPTEVIVVGRDEDVESHKLVEAISQTAMFVRWVGGAPPGHVGPVKLGLRETRTELVAFLDDDVVPEEGWLSALLDCLSEPRVACVGGRVVTPGFRGRIHADAGQVRWYGKYVGNIGALDCPEPISVAAVPEGNSAWRSVVLRSLEFDQRLDFDDASMYGLDLTMQARNLGYDVVYTPFARVRNESAPRDPSLEREDRLPRIRAYNRNFTLIALRQLRGAQRLSFTVWSVLVGERGGYGLLAGGLALLGKREGAWPEIKASTHGKLVGLALWVGKEARRG
jgi:GT2 family glycosyltransferase